ncbi:MAPEG family protein [soil metagenome]
MTIAYWCVLFAGILPILTVAIAKLKPGFDNANPRAWLERQEGLRRRADFAHRNHFEAFPFFAIAVLIAGQMHAAQSAIDTLALTFILARIAFTIFYLADLPSMRTIAFTIAYGCVIGLFFIGR